MVGLSKGISFAIVSVTTANTCPVDSSNVVLAAANCARSSQKQCKSLHYCQWSCPDTKLNNTKSEGCGPANTACESNDKQSCLAAKECEWQYCCNLKQDHLDTIVAKKNLVSVCADIQKAACTPSQTDSACVFVNGTCRVNGDNVIDTGAQRTLWSFATGGADDKVSGGPWPASFISQYNSNFQEECDAAKAKGADCSEIATDEYLTAHLTEDSIRHYKSSMKCATANTSTECAQVDEDCEWVLGAGDMTADDTHHCILSPKGAILLSLGETNTCSSVSTPVQVIAYSVFCLFAVLAVAGDVKQNGKDALREWIGVFKENIVSIGALSLFIGLYTLVFLREWVLNMSAVGGLLITIVGLTIFARGLATGLMPLAENVGRDLPARIPIPFVLVVIFCLGVLCTIAEPSIQALQKAGDTVSFANAPYVSILLNAAYTPHGEDAAQNWVFIMQIMVGIGVGVAAVIGTLRLVFSHGVKKYAATTFMPPLTMTLIACFFYATEPEHLERSTGLAWDCGAVTTGPVTVPIVLALGIGMAAASRAKREAKAAGAEPQVSPSIFSSRAGGASLLVEQNVDRRSRSVIGGSSVLTNSLMASRQGGGIVADAEAAAAGAKEEEGPNLDGFGIVTFASLLPAFTVWALTFFAYSKFESNVEAGVASTCPAYVSLTSLSDFQNGITPPTPFWCVFMSAITASVGAVGPLVGFLLFAQFVLVRRVPEGVFGLLYGCLVTLIGMVCFNIGLVQSLNPIGVQVGKLMPQAQEFYGTHAGDVVMLVFGFMAGLGATFSEPALSALGDTVHALTKGEFKKSSLITSVALGVGTGICIGLAKIRWELPLWILLVVAYAIAFALTAVSEEAITCVAWDSAGVTTGPVTVPIVLALGGSIAQTNSVAEGFGILSCASFGPIIAVLLSAKIQEFTKKKKNNVSPAMLDN